MNRIPLRTLACCVLMGLVTAGCAQAEPPAAQANAPATGTPAPAMASLPDFTQIVKKNAPAVVHVEAKYNGRRREPRMRAGMPDDPQMELFRRFFGMPMMPSPEEQEHTSLGSGFILSSDGYILTNNHVVDGADAVTVRLQDRRTLKAKVIGTDPSYDIALLKVDESGLPAVSIGQSRSLEPGQWVLAIGSPFGLDYTVTQGIVSAVGRNLGNRDQPYTSFIQTDVPINRGNSGGPLFNLQGQVVGINSQIYSNTGGYLGVSFSIPIDVAMSAVQQIKDHGYVTRGQLGVQVRGVDGQIAKALNLDNPRGAIVGVVQEGSAADKAGIQVGDIITAYNGQPIMDAGDLPPVVGMTKPGTKVPVEILRNGKQQTIQVTVGEVPHDKAGASGNDHSPAQSGSAALGLSVRELDDDARRQLDLKAGEGVLIGDVTGPVAARAGLQPGDVILRVGQKNVASVSAFRAATRDVKPGDTVLLLVRRGDDTRFIALTVPSDK
ncbi:DegQ family serine endoprotease [Frateuria sp. STR12]|uniref:DegQ family serine endoprotease n=1 Tax=Frateuria hangzhouensis TaxID=2995589 RepID=UPI002260A438|nr:DegQ family serine endoprotease [Frateuria sp. STR12]MCX7514925.1 DegQ family serine endoprotease [Frateuria sp. STR12]